MATDTSVRVVGRRLPVLDIALRKRLALVEFYQESVTYLAVDELEIPRALGIAVTSSVLGTSLVGGVLLHAAVCIH